MKNSLEPTRKELLLFAFIWSAIFIIVALYPISSGGDIRVWAISISILFPLMSFVPPLFIPIYKIWVKFGEIVGRINSFIILSILFYFIITPTGIVMRLLGKDLLNKKIDKKGNSYWTKHHSDSTMKQQF